MFCWGEDSQRGFWLQRRPEAPDEAAVHHLEVRYRLSDLSAASSVLGFVKSNGNAFIMRTAESRDGRRVRGKQKFVKSKEKMKAVSCGDEADVMLLSDRGALLSVDSTHTPPTARPLEAFSNIQVSQVSCGIKHSVVLTRDGRVFTWGQNSRGQLGLGKKSSGSGSPQLVQTLSEIPLVQVCAGGEQSFVLSVSGGLFSWGRNDCGQLGLGDTTDRSTPTSVQCLNMKKTVHVSCGKDHTAILTKHGSVFTFGSGQFGQLGHNSTRNEVRPRLVAELWGAKVTKIACGRNHTLVLTDTRKVYSFGCDDQGQLGRGDDPTVPLPVQLPNEPNNMEIRNIFAAENCSFATCLSHQDVHEDSNPESLTQHRLDDVIDKWSSESDPKSWKKITQEIWRMFSSACCLNQSFLEQSRDKHFQTSPKFCGLNLKRARRAFKKLVKKDDVRAEVEAAVLKLLPSLQKKTLSVEGLRIYLLLIELLHVIQKHTRQWSTKLAEAVAAAVISLSVESLQVIGDWWSSLSASTMVRYVTVWKQAIAVILTSESDPYKSGVRNLLQVLQYMYNANSKVAESQRIPDSDFCLVIYRDFLHGDLLLWRLQCRRGWVNPQPVIVGNFPIVMDLQSKTMVFGLNAYYNKVGEIPELLVNFFMSLGCPDMDYEYFELELRRASVLEDTFEELAAADPKDYKRRLAVFFDGNFELDNLYIKDFFYEVFHEMVSAESGMFMFNDSETLAWFPSTAAQEDQRFYMFGVLCGLALYNQHIIYLPFPLVLFKKLLGVKPSLEDMIEFSPTVGESLQAILEEYTDDDFEILYMDFLINWDGKEVDLDPKNPEKPLTSRNKREFVDAYVNHAFNTSVETVFQAFKRGFFQVCERDLVKLFRPKELQEVMVGKHFQDWEKLKQNTRYEGDFNSNHHTVQMFWEVFEELSENQKKAFLWFVTGFEQVPVLSKDKIAMKIRVRHVEDLDYDRYYPETQTCFSELQIPLYSTKEIMRTKLMEALSNNRRIRQ
ncbi:probable E3 ubiquitin-protein ligase HERC4 [Acanthochromis polyacanthus]|uniref:probable E3 ubiquitin-protein ligase HERC4 n=1 Tax=Acanthochromis polyacanthus TaxID=80966 RepID=UPI0022348B82|nr:probable E3 ubiquitin-protein ligase HERC4 [Acanthochromis polyacanthus]